MTAHFKAGDASFVLFLCDNTNDAVLFVAFKLKRYVVVLSSMLDTVEICMSTCRDKKKIKKNTDESFLSSFSPLTQLSTNQ